VKEGAVHPKRSLKRKARHVLAVALKFLFLLGMGIDAILDAVYTAASAMVDLLGLRCVLRYLGRVRDSIDDWLRRRSAWFALAIVGLILVTLGILDVWKGILLYEGHFRMVAFVSVTDKFTIVILFKHLLHVYEELLLSYPKIRLIYEKCATIKTNALAWLHESDWYVDAAIFVEEWRLRARYSFFGFIWRSAKMHRCCLLGAI
jgi:hypothetical protein